MVLQPHPSAPSRPGHPIGPSPPPHRPPCPTRGHLATPQAQNRPNMLSLCYKASDRASPSILAHYAPLPSLYHSLSSRTRAPTCAAKETGFHARVL
jgi:hypothetical protein